MNKTLLILRYELLTAIRSKSFLFTVFGLEGQRHQRTRRVNRPFGCLPSSG